MREFNLDLLIGKDVVVNCKTIEEEQEFLEFLDNKCTEWLDGCGIFKQNRYYFNKYKENTCFAFGNNKGLVFRGLDFYERHGYKILSLDDLLIKPKNNFKDYGFEADFEGEILKEVKDCRNQKYYIGYSIDIREGLGYPYPKAWLSSGACIDDDNNIVEDFSLKPIKKEWYEKEDNFRIAVKLTKSINDFKDKDGYVYIMEKFTDKKGASQYVTDGYHTPIQWLKCYRPATKEEILSLMKI